MRKFFFLVFIVLWSPSSFADCDSNDPSECEQALPAEVEQNIYTREGKGHVMACVGGRRSYADCNAEAQNFEMGLCRQNPSISGCSQKLGEGAGASDPLGPNYTSGVTQPGGRPAPGSNEGYAGAPSSMLDRVDALESQLQQCKLKLRETATCCGNPMSCLTGDGSGGQHSGVLMALQVAAGSATAMASISGACGTLGTISTGMAAINAALAFKCTSKINQCNAACGNVKQNAQSLLSRCQSGNCADEAAIRDQCTADGNSNINACVRAGQRTASQEYATRLRNVAQEADECDTWGGKAVEQQSQAVASMYAAKVAGLCKQASNTNPNGNNTAGNSFNVNCSDPTNAANPICQNQCNRANALNDPVCAQLLGQGTPGFGLAKPGEGLLANGSSPSGNGSIDEFEDQQAFMDPNVGANANKANVGSAGGGGIPGGGGGTGGGMDGGVAGAGGGAGGLDTDVLQGVKSGSGYTQPFVRSSVGGGGGYSSPTGGRGVASNGKPFNPRDFLPGGKMDPKRKLAGLAATTPQIGAVHGDIFKNISNRFFQVCTRDALYDCEAVRKNAKPKN